jgi:hypothetical protein
MSAANVEQYLSTHMSGRAHDGISTSPLKHEFLEHSITWVVS